MAVESQAARRTPTAAAALESLVRTAVAQKELNGICELLRSIATSMSAYGCFLWQASDDSDLEGDPPHGSLSVVAHWFSDGKSWALDGIELDSVVGQVATSRQRRNVLRVEESGDISRKFYWWIERNGIRSFCAFPVTFLDGPRGSLAIYRKDQEPFSDQELDLAGRLADLLPGLYQAVRNRVSFDLVAQIEELTGQASPSDDAQSRDALQLVCAAIGRKFNSHETSIFLRDPLAGPDEYQLQATTWPPMTPFSPRSYTLADAGITPWVIRRAEGIRLFNLGACEPGRPIDESRYPGLLWRDPLQLVETMMKARSAASRDELPPLSYMCAPVMEGNRALGAIRCCSMLKPPFIYASRDLALLKVASALVGKYWATKTEIKGWRGFVKSISDLNRLAEQELARDTPEAGRIKDACRTVESTFASGRDDFLKVMLDLVRQQEQLYARLGTTIAERAKVQVELQKTLERQHQTYEDLFHQIKSPINAAFETIRSALHGGATREAYRASLEALRSQLRRANTITRSVGIFAELAADEVILAHRSAKLQQRTFQRTAIEMAEDYERMTEKYRNIRFEVVAKGFEVLNRYEVWVDEGLLFHALANVLDNAGKYSYADSVVQVSAGITGTGRFHLSVTNKGLRIRTEHLPRLTERGFRSDEAMSASGEGSGIGLFIVQRIMDAHNGELLIIPANQEGRTEVKLLFPAGKIGPH